MRPYVIKSNDVVIDSPVNNGEYFLRTYDSGRLHIGTSSAHMALDASSIVTVPPIKTVAGSEYLHEANLSDKTALVMGYADPAKTETYAAGLCPAGAAYEGTPDEQHYFLSKNGEWAIPNSAYTGAVYTSFKALSDTPSDFTFHQSNFLKIQNDKVVAVDLSTELAGMTLPVLTAQSVQSVSDINAKEDVQEFGDEACEQTLEIAKKMRMIKFKYKDDDEKHTHLGVVAQNLQEIFPESVRQGPKYKQVDFVQLVGLLLANTKALIAKVDRLEERLDMGAADTQS